MDENDDGFLYEFLYNNSPAEQIVERSDVAQFLASPNSQDLQEMEPVDFSQLTQSDVSCSNVYPSANMRRLHHFDEDGFPQAPISSIYSFSPPTPIASSFQEKNENIRENFIGSLTPNADYKLPSLSPPANYSPYQPEQGPMATSSPYKNPHQQGNFTLLKNKQPIDTTQEEHRPSQQRPLNSPVLQPLFLDVRPLQSNSPYSLPAMNSLQSEDAILMPPPPIPSIKKNYVTTLTARDVVITLAAYRLVGGPSAWMLYRLMNPNRYDILEEHKAIEIFITISNRLHKVDPNYQNTLKKYVRYILNEMHKIKSEFSFVFMAAFERTRARYINAMASINCNSTRNMRQPSYHWGDITRLTDLNSAVIGEVIRISGQRNICSDVIDWCLYCFKAWHIDAWVDIKGGWEAILISNEGHHLFTTSQVVERKRKK